MELPYKMDVIWCRMFQSVLKIGNYFMGYRMPAYLEGAGKIRAKEPFPELHHGFVDRLKSGLVNRMFYPCFVADKKFFVTEGCNGCGLCEKLCPLNNITMVDGKPKWGGNCTQCMACICGCPKEAMEYGRRSKGKIRYQCPEYQG